jgi:hypothetical protein
MLQRTGEAETITTHYLFALGAYRALYIPNWIYRYFFEVPRYWDPIAVIAGIVQTILYSDFFWIYYTKYVFRLTDMDATADVPLGLFRARSSIYPYKHSGSAHHCLHAFLERVRALGAQCTVCNISDAPCGREESAWWYALGV